MDKHYTVLSQLLPVHNKWLSFLAQPEHLEQSPEKTESASEAKVHQAIDGRHLKECEITYLSINAAGSSAELYRQCSLCLYGVHVDTFMFVLVDLIKIVQKVFWSGYLINILNFLRYVKLLHGITAGSNSQN